MTPRLDLRGCTIEVTTACNLRCTGCMRTTGVATGAWATRHMPVSTFARVIANLPAMDRLWLHGIGEPTLHPAYAELVSLAAATGKFRTISAATHAMARDAAYYRELVARGLGWLAVSVDSLTPDVAERVRAGSDVRRLRATLAELLTLPIPVDVTTVASRLNLQDLPRTFDALNGLGRMTVNLQPFIDLGNPVGCLTDADVQAVKHLLLEAPERWPRLTIAPRLTLDPSPVLTPCPDPWQGLGVTVDGYLTPCCVTWDAEILGRSSVAAQPLEEIFAGPIVQQFLEAYLKEAPAFCAGCPKNARVVRVDGRIDRHPPIPLELRRAG